MAHNLYDGVRYVKCNFAKSLAVLWDFKGLQGFQTSFDAFQIFLLQPPLFGRILDAAGPHSAASLGARPAVRLSLQ
jgi:hypothetical protein